MRALCSMSFRASVYGMLQVMHDLELTLSNMYIYGWRENDFDFRKSLFIFNPTVCDVISHVTLDRWLTPFARAIVAEVPHKRRP